MALAELAFAKSKEEEAEEKAQAHEFVSKMQ